MNITKEMIDEATKLLPSGCSNELLGQLLVADATRECDNTLATIAQKVLDMLP
jgi:hypothetical protein